MSSLRTAQRRRRASQALLAAAVLQALVVSLVLAAPPSDQPPAANTAEPPPQPQVVAPPTSAPAADPQAQEAGLARLRLSHRSTTAAVVMSLPWPGWGQLYADAPFWGALAFTVQMFYLGNILMESRREARQRTARGIEPIDSERFNQRNLLVTEHGERVRDFVWWAGGALLLVSLDAYVSVSLVDFDDPGVRVPELGPEPPAPDNGAGAALSLSWRF